MRAIIPCIAPHHDQSTVVRCDKLVGSHDLSGSYWHCTNGKRELYLHESSKLLVLESTQASRDAVYPLNPAVCDQDDYAPFDVHQSAGYRAAH